MNAIIDYAKEFQYREIRAGRNPRTIRLTREQVEYVDAWLKENNIPMVADPRLDGKRQIMGMEVIEV